MRKNKTLPAIRITSELYNKLIAAIETLNKNNAVEFSISDFRRLAYQQLADRIAASELSFILRITK